MPPSQAGSATSSQARAKRSAAEQAEYELRIQTAIEGKASGRYKSWRAAAMDNQVALQTLRDRAFGHHKSRKEGHESQQILTPTQEATLVEWIDHRSKAAMPLDPQSVYKAAYNITGQYPGKNWQYRFQLRNVDSGLYLAKPSGLDPKRAENFNRAVVSDYFDKRQQINEFTGGIPPEHDWNSDEKGIQLGGGRKGNKRKYYYLRRNKNRYRLRSDNLELVTVIECISAAGEVMPPGFILAEGRLPDPASSPLFAGVGTIATSPSGWVDNELHAGWFEKVFVPNAIKRRVNSQPIVLTLDGHNSHETPEMRRIATENNIILFCLPSKTTHRLQPLDVVVFSSVQNAWYSHCSLRLAQGIKMDRYNVVQEYMVARQVITPQLVKKAFEKSGIFPFNPNIFTDEDYAPSTISSTGGIFPPSYPVPSSSRGGVAERDNGEGEEGEGIQLRWENRMEWEEWEEWEDEMEWDEEDDDEDDDEDGDEDGDGDGDRDRDRDGDDDEEDDDDEDDDEGPSEAPEVTVISPSIPLFHPSPRFLPRLPNIGTVSPSPALRGSDISSTRVSGGGVLSRQGSANFSGGSDSIPFGASALTPAPSDHLPRRDSGVHTPQSNPRPVSEVLTNQQEVALTQDARREMPELMTEVRRLRQQNMKTNDELVRARQEVEDLKKKLEASNTHCVMAMDHASTVQEKLDNHTKKSKRQSVKVNARILTMPALAEQAATGRIAKDARIAQIAADTVDKIFDSSLSHYKKKDDLLVLAGALKIPDNGTVSELYARIKDYLAEHPELGQDPRFVGLFQRRTKRSQASAQSHATAGDTSELSSSAQTALVSSAGPPSSYPSLSPVGTSQASSSAVASSSSWRPAPSGFLLYPPDTTFTANNSSSSSWAHDHLHPPRQDTFHLPTQLSYQESHQAGMWVPYNPHLESSESNFFPRTDSGSNFRTASSYDYPTSMPPPPNPATGHPWPWQN